MRILVCGGRDYKDQNAVNLALDRVKSQYGTIEVVIHGGASGADDFGAQWGHKHATKGHLRFNADWNRHGKAAGPIRNERMIQEGEPDGCIAFPGGRGTKDMIDRCIKHGIPVWEPMKERT